MLTSARLANTWVFAICALFWAAFAGASDVIAAPSAPASQAKPPAKAPAASTTGSGALPGAAQAPKPTGFILYKASADQLGLYFKPADPQWELNRKAPIVVQLLASSGVQLNPDLLFASNFATEAPVGIAIKGATPGKSFRVSGKGTFTLCHKTRRDCRDELSAFELEVVP